MLVCPSGFFLFFFSSLALSLFLSLQRTGLPVSHSLPLICFSVWQSKHCPSDTSVCLRLSFHLWRWEWNAIWQEVGFTVCYLPVAQSPPLSSPPTDLSCLIWVSELIHSAAYLISEAGLSYGQKKKNEPIRSSSSQSEAIHIISRLTRTHISNWCSGWQVWSTKNLNAECGRFPLRASSLRFFYSDSSLTVLTSELYLALRHAVIIFLKCSTSC